MSSIADGKMARRGQWTVLLILFLAIALVCNRGFDLTDESYYVLWTFYPKHFEASIHPFGLLLNVVTQGIGKSIIALRVFGVVLLAGCGIVLGGYVGEYYRRVAGRQLGFDARALAAIFALGNYAVISILTPGYNLLANAAGSLILAGALGWAIHDDEPVAEALADVVPSILVGIGGAIAFFAKPTFAALAAAVIIGQLALGWRRHGALVALRRAGVTGAACVVPAALVLSSTVGFGHFVETIGTGLATLKFGNGLASLPRKTAADLVHAPLPLLVAVLVFAGVAGWRMRNRHDTAPCWALIGAGGAVALAFCYFALVLTHMVFQGKSALGPIAGPIWVLAVTCTILGIVRRKPAAVDWRRWWPVAALLALPFATAFGTANSLVQQTSASLYAPLLAAAIAGDLLFSRRVAAILQAAAVGYTALLLLWSSHVPYGLPAPISAQTEPLRILPGGDVLYVDRVTYRYAARLRDIATRHNLSPDTPIIDLSGGGPGTALLLNGNAPYFPWLVHIFGTNSTQLADTVWASLSPSQQRQAWMVLPADPVFANSKAMSDFRSKGNYRLLGRAPMEFWGVERQIEIWAQP